MPDNRHDTSLAQAASAARTMQAALSLGRRLDLWSLLFALLALICLFSQPLAWLSRTGLLVSLLAAGIQKYFALRVAFDEQLFRNLARQWTDKAPAEGSSPLAELAALDQSLARCLQCRPKTDKVRDLNSRLLGTSRLLKRQVLTFSVQFASLLAAATAAGLPLAG